jgi:hypothetical protein
MDRSRSFISGTTVSTSNVGSGSSETMEQPENFVVKFAANVSDDEHFAEGGVSGYFSASSDDMSSSEDEGNSEYRRRPSHASSGSRSALESVTARKDTRIAARLRILVALLFLTMGIVFPIIIFKTTRSNEVEAFEASFDGLAIKLTSSMESSLSRKFGALESLRVAISSHAQTSNTSWPYITVPDYDLRAENAIALGGLLSVSLHPLVKVNEKLTWEDYSVSNIAWLEQSINRTSSANSVSAGAVGSKDRPLFQQQHPTTGSLSVVCRPPATPLGFPQEIYDLEPYSEYGACVHKGKNSTYPLWQIHPPAALVINLNALSVPASIDSVQSVTNSGDAVLSRIQFPYIEGKEMNSVAQESTVEGIQHSLGLNETISDAHAVIYYPIFQNLESSPNSIVGMLAAVITFEEFFAAVLPPSTYIKESVVCVVKNECGDVMSYMVTGEQAMYLGPIDAHKRTFDYIVHEYRFGWSVDPITAGGGGTMGVELNGDFCPYLLSVYPDDDMYDSYVTSQPKIFSISLAMAIVAVAVTALTYDYFMQRRMRRAVKSAKENHAIVSRLFPENIRTRMIQEEEDRKRAEETKRRSSNEGNTRRNSNEEPRRLSGDGRKQSSVEGRRRFSNDARRRVSNEREGTGGISDYIPIINAVGTVGNAVGNVGHAVVEFTSMALAPAKMRLRSFLDRESSVDDIRSQHYNPSISIHSLHEHESNPIADLFPHCTGKLQICVGMSERGMLRILSHF